MRSPETLPSAPSATTPARLRLPWQAWRDLQLALIGVLLLGLIHLVPDPGWLAALQIGLGFAYVLFVPGYCLQTAIFPSPDDLDQIERFGLSLGLSIATVPVLALVLHALPWGLHPTPMLVGQAALICVFVLGAYWRRTTMYATTATPVPTPTAPRQWWQQRNPIEQMLLGGIASIVLIIGIAFVWAFATPDAQRSLTEFYILGSSGQALGYPRTATVGEEIGVTLGIANYEGSPQTYRVEVWATWAWEPETYLTPLAELEPLTVPHAEAVELPVTWAMPWEADDAQVYLRLYREGDSEAYRELLLWLDVQAADSLPPASR